MFYLATTVAGTLFLVRRIIVHVRNDPFSKGASGSSFHLDFLREVCKLPKTFELHVLVCSVNSKPSFTRSSIYFKCCTVR